MIDLHEAYGEFLQTYTRTRYVITNTFDGEVRVGTDLDIIAYIHPDDYEKQVYNEQAQRYEERIKIFVDLNVDITVGDEVVYFGRKYKVVADSAKVVGNYKKLLAELVQ